MPNIGPEGWKAPGPYITMRREHGTVTVWAEGDEPGSVVVRATGQITYEKSFPSHQAAIEPAHELAEQLGDRI
jgi:RecB family endonuclease NucS